MFLSSTGVDLARGLSEFDDAQASIKRRMMEAAERVYLLVDHSKFESRFFDDMATPFEQGIRETADWYQAR